MHKSILSIAAIAFTLTTGCSDNNPYMDKPEAAKQKTQECLNDLHAATQKQNKAEINRLTSDQECLKANKAHATHVNQSKISPAIPPSTQKHDAENPYLQDPKVAKQKTQECINKLHDAMNRQDQKEMTELSQNAECAMANRAHSQHVNSQLITPASIPENNGADAQSTEIDSKEIDAAVIKQKTKWENEYRELEFRSFYQLSKKCLTSMVERKTAKCAVVRSLIDERYQTEVDKISSQYQGDALEAYAKESCIGENKDDDKCEIALRASGKMRN